jgi:hypothetical protein
MAEIKKTSASKKTAPKAHAATAASSPSPSIRPAAKPQVGRTITAEERARMVQESAYYRAEKRGFQGDPHEDWVAAEKEISSKLARENIKIS